MNSRLLIVNGRVIDPSQQLDRVTHVLVEDRKIVAYDVPGHDDAVHIDAAGCIVAPGLVDMHAQLREPGYEEDETIETGTRAALSGGFTSIACIANTDPPIDTQASVEFVRQKAARAGNCNVFVIGCVSKNRLGEELAELGILSEAGAVAFSDAGRPIHNSELLRRALEYCLMFDKPVLNHPEVLELSHNGIMHEGDVSLALGLSGMPAEAEDVMIGRDLRLAEATKGRMHLMNVSSEVGVELIRQAKNRGVRVSAEICPPHFTLTDECLRTFDPDYKLNPPLRSQTHVEACIAGLRDGTIDVIASGHAPRAAEKKMLELNHAPFGASTLETTLAMTISQLINPGHLDWSAALAKLTINPARVLGIDKGTLAVGADADITIIDPQAAWTIGVESESKSSNSPFNGWQMTGRAVTVIVDGEVRFSLA